MKKFLSIVFCAILCLCLFAFVGCNDDKKACEGIYYFHDGTGNMSGTSVFFDMKDERTGLYPNVDGGEVDFSKIYIELKDGKMTFHGSINYAVTPQGLKLVVNPDAVEEYEYTLVAREKGYYGYYIYIDGKDSGYSVSPPDGHPIGNDYDNGSIFYSYGKQDDDIYVIFNWTKILATKFSQN